jgi:hypothetical protein
LDQARHRARRRFCLAQGFPAAHPADRLKNMSLKRDSRVQRVVGKQAGQRWLFGMIPVSPGKRSPGFF